jgi:hypothetical protein
MLITKEEAKEVKRITYKSKVSGCDFYEGQLGEVLEMRFGTKKIAIPTTCGSYWAESAITEYKVKWTDGNEVWVDSNMVIAG